jgi:hypothetical protein
MPSLMQMLGLLFVSAAHGLGAFVFLRHPWGLLFTFFMEPYLILRAKRRRIRIALAFLTSELYVVVLAEPI